MIFKNWAIKDNSKVDYNLHTVVIIKSAYTVQFLLTEVEFKFQIPNKPYLASIYVFNSLKDFNLQKLKLFVL